MSDYPEKYWHCAVKLINQKRHAVVNDLSFEEINEKIIQPWLNSKTFTIDGKIVSSRDQLEEIKITRTPEPQDHYARIHNEKMKRSGIWDAATNREMLPLDEGEDYTDKLLFQSKPQKENISIEPSAAIVERVCKRICYVANILGKRQRKGKKPFLVEDEYDVQDLLHATLRAFIKYSVQEDPLSKIAGRSSRADITIEDLGILIEVKYVRGPNDQRTIIEELSQDLLLYTKWEPLETLLFVVYNSNDLRDPESLEKFSGEQEINGKKFKLKVILV
ncbi:MAG TPA: hypothetical protein VMW25_03580 [Clostridia bacterium]|nr:hypothetical protein [Clostridia bacterium]